MSYHPESSLKNIPVEVVSHILSSLPFQDQVIARLVCNYWRALLDASGNYKFRAIIEDNNSIDFLLNSCREMDFVRLSCVTKEMPSMTYSRNRFPNIRKVLIGNENSGPVILSFLKYGFEALEVLKLTGYAFENIQRRQIGNVLAEVNWKKLAELEITILMTNVKLTRSRRTLESWIEFLKFVKIPSLKKLIVFVIHSSQLGDGGILIRKFSDELYGFISRHSEPLKMLYWNLRTEMLTPEFPVYPMSDGIMETIRSNLKLRIYSVQIHGPNNISLAMPSSLGSDSLTSFTYQNRHLQLQNIQPIISQHIDETLQRNKMSLTNVNVTFMFFNMNWLKNCRKLQTLTIEIKAFEVGLTNMSVDNISFPELTTFRLDAFYYNLPNNFEAWIVERMKNVENITLRTYFAYMSVPVLQTLIGRLHRLQKITIAFDIMPYSNLSTVEEFCNSTPGLSFRILGRSLNGLFVTYVIEIER